MIGTLEKICAQVRLRTFSNCQAFQQPRKHISNNLIRSNWITTQPQCIPIYYRRILIKDRCKSNLVKIICGYQITVWFVHIHVNVRRYIQDVSGTKKLLLNRFLLFSKIFLLFTLHLPSCRETLYLRKVSSYSIETKIPSLKGNCIFIALLYSNIHQISIDYTNLSKAISSITFRIGPEVTLFISVMGIS